MADASSSSFVLPRPQSGDLSGSVFLIAANGSMLSLPMPSTSPRDPLNWSFNKRVRAFASMIFFSIVGLAEVQGPSLMLAGLSQEYASEETKPFHLDLLSSAPTLFMGVGAFVWIPLSLAVGRRPVFLLCTIILLLATMLAVVSGNLYVHLVAVCLQGLSVGISSSTMLLMTIDLTFIHQRPQAIATFWSVGAFFVLLVLSVVPRITNGWLNWRTFYIIFMIPCIIAVVLAFLFYPETYFLRPAVAFDGRVLVQSATEKVKIYADWEEVPGGKALPDTPANCKWSATIKQLKIWGKTGSGWEAMWACYPQILLCMVNPLIFWVALLNAIVFGSMMSIGETYSITLSGAPYFLPNDTIALVNFGAAFGALLAWPAAGLMSSMISRRLAMSNRGVRDAEHFLPAFVVPILSGVASVTLYGLTIENKWHPVWVYIAYALNALSFYSLAVANTLWVTEAFPRWAAPALVVLGGWSYVASFGTSYAIFPWIKSQGYAAMNIEIAAMIFVVGGMIVPVSFWGKSLRQYIQGKWGMNEAGALRPQ